MKIKEKEVGGRDGEGEGTRRVKNGHNTVRYEGGNECREDGDHTAGKVAMCAKERSPCVCACLCVYVTKVIH